MPNYTKPVWYDKLVSSRIDKELERDGLPAADRVKAWELHFAALDCVRYLNGVEPGFLFDRDRFEASPDSYIDQIQASSKQLLERYPKSEGLSASTKDVSNRCGTAKIMLRRLRHNLS